MIRRLTVDVEVWPLAKSLKISGHVFTDIKVVVATLTEGEHQGRGEAAGVYYQGDSPAGMMRQLEAARERIEAGVTREGLPALIPPGGARNAIDCALWELQSRQERQPIWRLAGSAAPSAPLRTTYTIGADRPEIMAEDAVRGMYRAATAIKLKLLGDGLDADRVHAVRSARPDVWMGVDGNQGFTIHGLTALMPALVDARVALIEQPCKRGDEDLLDGFMSPIPLAADESVQSAADLARLVGRFDVINIKLDKCGGLTAALKMAEEARRLGFRVMVGNMGGTSLAMAPAAIVGQGCDVVDLDGPLFLVSDRIPSVRYDHGVLSVPADLWGWPE